MFILNQSRNEVINVEHISHINIEDDVICAYMTDKNNRILGIYKNAAETYELLIKELAEDRAKLIIMP